MPQMHQQLDEWLENKQKGQWGALKDHADLVKNLIESKVRPLDAAKELRHNQTIQPKDADSLWRLWNLLFDAAAEIPESQDAIVSLTLALRQSPPEHKQATDITYSLWPNWRDRYDGFHGRRSLSQNKLDPLSGTLSGAEKWINFSRFSAKLVQHGDNNFAREIGVFGFFELRDVLETKSEMYQEKLLRHSNITANELVRCDVVSAAHWVVYAGAKLHGLDNDFFGEGWARGLAAATDLWSDKPGFSAGRWDLWRKMFELKAEDAKLDESAKKAASEAAAVILGFTHVSHAS